VPWSAPSGVDTLASALADRSFDQLLWIAPDVAADESGRDDDERIVDQQEHGVLAVFRVVKALVQSGHANRTLRWTLIVSRTQRVAEGEPIHPTHAGIVGFVGGLAREYPRWDVRLVDVESLTSVPARECLSLPFDKQGNPLVHRRGEWFQQGLARIATMPPVTSIYRQNGVYVVVGGAGGIGDVWTRFMIEHYAANVVWIGRRPCDAAIQAKVDALTRPGHALLYISADATNVDALERARKTILDTYPAIHGVVHSAVVLRDQSIASMDESTFKATLAAKVDISVNIDRVFGRDELDLILFFSSIISFFKGPKQSNYAAGCTFKDSFAHKLRQVRSYAVKTVNWGYWGGVGVVADDSHNKVMAQLGLGSIEPSEGMAALQALVNSDVPQVAVIKTLNSQVTAGLLSDAVTYYPKTAKMILPHVQRVHAGAALPATPEPAVTKLLEVL